jgi:hypothetical protein
VAACAQEASTAAVPCEREATAAARSLLGDTVAALSLCVAGAMVIAAMAIAATVSVRRRWVRLRSVRLRLGPTAVAAVTTPTATGFVRAGITGTEWPTLAINADGEVGRLPYKK